MATYESLLEEYHSYLEEKKALGAIGASAIMALGAGQMMNKNAKADAAIQYTSDNAGHLYGDGDWFDPNPNDAATPTDHPDHQRAAPRQQAPKAAQGSGINFNKADLDSLAMTLWGEARSEGEAGMRSVAHVALNRAKHETRWSDSIKSVVHQDKQFSCWNEDDPNRAKMLKMQEYYDYLKAKPKGYEQWYAAFQQSKEYPSFQLYLQARKVARSVLTGQSRDVTGGSLFYHTTGVSPNWAVGQKVVAKVGDHVFYRTDRKA